MIFGLLYQVLFCSFCFLQTLCLKDFVTKENANFHAAVEDGEGSQTYKVSLTTALAKHVQPLQQISTNHSLCSSQCFIANASKWERTTACCFWGCGRSRSCPAQVLWYLFHVQWKSPKACWHSRQWRCVPETLAWTLLALLAIQHCGCVGKCIQMSWNCKHQLLARNSLLQSNCCSSVFRCNCLEMKYTPMLQSFFQLSFAHNMFSKRFKRMCKQWIS